MNTPERLFDHDDQEQSNESNYYDGPSNHSQNEGVSCISPIPLSSIGSSANKKGGVPSASDLAAFDQLAQTISQPPSVINRDAARRRDKIQSFIEFDDDDDDHHRNGCVGGKSHRRPYNSTVDYGQELINVFNTSSDNHADHINGNVVPENNLNGSCLGENGNSPTTNQTNEFEDSDEEWNQFQRSEMVNPNAQLHFEQFGDNGGQPTSELAKVPSPSPSLDSDHSRSSDDQSESQDTDYMDQNSGMLYGRLQQMEQEQDLLNNSLLALTSHFAQVQLRLRQIVEAKDLNVERREILLKELENFANRGIPELMLFAPPTQSMERSVSMATSLMADDVFEEDNETNHHADDFDVDQRCGRKSSWKQSLSNFDCESVNSKGLSRHNSTSTTAMITEEKLERQRSRQKELISQLKDQLEDLERYAYETGDLNSLPSSMLLERQNAIIEQLKSKLPVLSIEEIDKLSPEELRLKVDHAVKELVNPVIMKEQLVSQLKTQVTDLERFIEFLQQGGKRTKAGVQQQSGSSFTRMSKLLKLRKSSPNDQRNGQSTKSNDSNTEKHTSGKRSASAQHQSTSYTNGGGYNSNQCNLESANQTGGAGAANIIRRILSLLHMFAWTQFGTCASFVGHRNSRPNFEQNILKKTTTYGRHWGDLRAQLEVAIEGILEFYRDKNMNDSDYTSDSEEFGTVTETNFVTNNYFAYEQMTTLVRKDLSVALRNLIQHGLVGCSNIDPNNSTLTAMNSSVAATGNGFNSLLSLGLGCFSTRSAPMIRSRPMHAWELILYYYDIKNGSKFRSTPTRRLSQSYGLQVMAGSSLNAKHSLLASIDDIIDSHTRLKRSLDSHFKAFVCTALNKRMLSQWLRLIVRNTNIVNDCYEKWSYTASTGFDDALRQLDKLSSLRFCLPTDLAVRQLQSIHDAF